MPESFSKTLTRISTKYNSSDIDWVKYVQDHYQIIFDSSEVVAINPFEHYWRHYRLEDYLHEQGYDPNIAWIVKMINQMPSNVDFKDLSDIRIPSSSTIDALYKQFLQYRSHIKSCRNQH